MKIGVPEYPEKICDVQKRLFSRKLSLYTTTKTRTVGGKDDMDNGLIVQLFHTFRWLYIVTTAFLNRFLPEKVLLSTLIIKGITLYLNAPCTSNCT